MTKYKNIGLKLTPQRLAILAFLEGNKKHPSAEDIYKEISKRFPTMSLATVYNTLESLRRKGYVLELSIDPDKKRYDPNVSPHCHLICIHCKKIVDVSVDYDINLPEKERSGFEIIGKHVDFYGICPQCKRNKEVMDNGSI
jgi:Fur family peroxide stress response transcriptional regulator